MPNPTPSSADMNKALFFHLVSMLSLSAMQALGKIINPLTGKTEVSLEGAQATIDLLDMLETKTRGNRDADEDKMLKDTLSMLKMNYVETANSERSRSERDKSAACPAKGGVSGEQPEQGRRGEPQKPEGNLSTEASAKVEDPQDDKETGRPEDKVPRGQGESHAKEKEQGKPETKDPKFHKSYS